MINVQFNVVLPNCQLARHYLEDRYRWFTPKWWIIRDIKRMVDDKYPDWLQIYIEIININKIKIVYNKNKDDEAQTIRQCDVNRKGECHRTKEKGGEQ